MARMKTSRTAWALSAILAVALTSGIMVLHRHARSTLAGTYPMVPAGARRYTGPQVSIGGGDVLVRAAAKGDVKAVQSLLDHGAPINAPDSSGDTALIAASECGRAAVVQLLLCRGADANARNRNGETALIQSASSGHLDVVKLLLAYHPDLNAQSQDPLFGSSTALMSAASGGHTAVVEALLDAGADPNIHDQRWAMTALAYAVRADHLYACGR